ncbi:CPBP family intramembrane metalloprotease [Cyanobacteria bacterium FACHB-502]|nr:CPBP family intramembrane glutamic endopeptidase [Leptolyngbya sp. FACHB-711]MBD1849662.1 CPBP family intramembrane metalloprotease [Cyanobacteria bacterium FACHB-502]MBD2028002.1 CPBP family intramembrane metalloprotease [Leptolyngbya sp. FACHB-711]
MGVTAIVLLLASRLWLLLDPVALLPLDWSIQSALWGVGLGVGITAASSITYRLWAGYRQSADYYLALIIQPLALPDLIWLGLLPALSEELLFRGVMLPSVGLNWYGLLISSLCFGVMHFSGREQWSYMIWATTIGLVLGWGALETGNLLVPVVAHIVTNLVSSCIWKWRMRDVAG